MSQGSLRPMADVTADAFEPLLGQMVEFHRPEASDNPARMRMVDLRRDYQMPDMAREPFSLLFAMKDQALLAPALHRLNLAGFEPLDLLICKVSTPKFERQYPGSIFYEVIFS
jgi:hypothetical protein